MNFSKCRVVRLNAERFPITRFEQEKYDEHGLTPTPLEAGAFDELADMERIGGTMTLVRRALTMAHDA